MSKEYLTIKEYARIREVSVSSVYKRLNTTLKQYLREAENRKVLDIKVLEDEGLTPSNKKVEETPSTPLQPISSIFEKELDIKNRQIEKLTEQIEKLQEDNREKDKFIQDQSRKLTELLEQSNILLQNNQILLAQQNDQEQKDIIPEAEEVDKSAASDEAEIHDREQPQKQSWFSKLFNLQPLQYSIISGRTIADNCQTL